MKKQIEPLKEKLDIYIQETEELICKIQNFLSENCFEQQLLDYLEKQRKDNSFAYRLVNADNKKIDRAIDQLQSLMQISQQSTNVRLKRKAEDNLILLIIIEFILIIIEFIIWNFSKKRPCLKKR